MFLVLKLKHRLIANTGYMYSTIQKGGKRSRTHSTVPVLYPTAYLLHNAAYHKDTARCFYNTVQSAVKPEGVDFVFT
jgi:hypothetical protein